MQLLGYNNRDLSELKHELISDTRLNILRKRKYKNRDNYTCWNKEKYVLASCDICDNKYWRPNRYRPERNPKFWAGELTTGYHTKHVCSSKCKSILNGLQKRKYTRKTPGINQHGYPYFEENGKLIKLHRLVYEETYNVKLTSKDIIHHKDMDKENYDIDNLELLTESEHSITHGSWNKQCKFFIDLGLVKYENDEYQLTDKAKKLKGDL